MLGTLSEFTLAHLLQLFALAEHAGTIEVHSQGRHARMLVESDRLIGVGALGYDVQLDIQRIALISQFERLELSDLAKRDDTPGMSFLVGNLVEPLRWSLFVGRALEQTIYPLLNESDGAFEITVERCPPALMKVSATVQQLILDGSRWEAESEALRSEGYDLDTTWRRARDMPNESEIVLDTVGWLVLALMATPSSVTVAAARLGIPELVASQSVKHLHGLGLLQSRP